MRKCFQFAGLLFVVLLLTGCATSGQYVVMPSQNVTVEDLTKARIYVIRPAGFVGSAISMIVKDGDTVIGNTRGGGRYLSWEREPGTITITSKSENQSTITFTVEAGMRYYVLQSVRMGVLMAQTAIEQVDSVEGEKHLKKCKPAEESQK